MKVVGLFKMCLNGTNSNARVSRHMPDELPVQNGLKREMICCHCFSFALDVLLGRS